MLSNHLSNFVGFRSLDGNTVLKDRHNWWYLCTSNLKSCRLSIMIFKDGTSPVSCKVSWDYDLLNILGLQGFQIIREPPGTLKFNCKLKWSCRLNIRNFAPVGYLFRAHRVRHDNTYLAGLYSCTIIPFWFLRSPYHAQVFKDFNQYIYILNPTSTVLMLSLRKKMSTYTVHQ